MTDLEKALFVVLERTGENLPPWAVKAMAFRALTARKAVVRVTRFNPIGRGLEILVERVVRRSLADYHAKLLEKRIG